MKYETVDSYDRLQLKTSRNTNNGIVVACGWAFYHGHVDEWISTQWRYAQTHHQSYQTVVFPSEMQKLMEICYFSNKLDEQSMWFSVWKSVTLPVSDETVRFSVNVVIVVIIKCVDTECFNSIHSQFYHQVFDVISGNSYTARLNVGRGKVRAEKWEFIILQKRWIVK